MPSRSSHLLDKWQAAGGDPAKLPSLHSPFWAPDAEAVVSTATEALTTLALDIHEVRRRMPLDLVRLDRTGRLKESADFLVVKARSQIRSLLGIGHLRNPLLLQKLMPDK